MATNHTSQTFINKGKRKKVELKRFNSEEELSSIRFSCEDEALGEVKNLFFRDQLSEEQILLEIYSPNGSEFTQLDLKRLNIDRVFSKRQISNRYLLKRFKLVDSYNYQGDYSVRTILEIKSEQRRLGVEFKGFYTLLPSNSFIKLKSEPLLFAEVGPNIFYSLNNYLMDNSRKPKFKIQNIFHWIKKRISSKTYTKS